MTNKTSAAQFSNANGSISTCFYSLYFIYISMVNCFHLLTNECETVDTKSYSLTVELPKDPINFRF